MPFSSQLNHIKGVFGLQNGIERNGIKENEIKENENEANKNINKIMFGWREWEWGMEKYIRVL